MKIKKNYGEERKCCNKRHNREKKISEINKSPKIQKYQRTKK